MTFNKMTKVWLTTKISSEALQWVTAHKLRNTGLEIIGVNFINILRATLLPIFWCQKIAKKNVIREKLLNLLSYKKCVRKMLMKLTPSLTVRWEDGYVRSKLGFGSMNEMKSIKAEIDRMGERMDS